MAKAKKGAANAPLKNLIDRTAPDSPGETKSVGVRLRPDQLEALAKLEGDRSFHVRQAIDQYLQNLGQ